MKAHKICILFTLVIFFLQIGLCQTNPNREIAKRYFEEVINQRRLDLFNQIFADTFLVHGLTDRSVERKTIAAQRTFLEYLIKAFPDIHYTVGDIIQEGDRVAMRVSLSATHKNEFWGYEASGKQIDYLSEIFFFRLENGKIVESWVQLDLNTLFKWLKGEK